MAEINVQRKEKSILPWIIGLVVLALLAWVLISMLGEDTETVGEGPEVEVVEPVTP